MVKITGYVHIAWIIVGLLNLHNINQSKVILYIIALYELYILIRHLRTKSFNHFIFIWRLVVGNLLFFPMFPFTIILPEYYTVLFIKNSINITCIGLELYFYCAILFWTIAVTNHHKGCFFEKKFYLVLLAISIMVLFLNTLYSEFRIFRLLTVTIYIIWLIITALEVLYSIKTKIVRETEV